MAFSAAVGHGKVHFQGLFDTDITLVYRNVTTNIGDAYNAVTGTTFLLPSPSYSDLNIVQVDLIVK